MLSIATWNLRWAAPGADRTEVIQLRLTTVAPDVAVLTEADLRTLESWKHVLDAGQHPNVPNPNRRKVAIASQLQMTLVDPIGSPSLPPNNFLAVDVETSDGTVRVIGVVGRISFPNLMDCIGADWAKSISGRPADLAWRTW